MDAKFFEIDTQNGSARARRRPASQPKILKDYRERLDVSWMFHDNALEGVVLSYSRAQGRDRSAHHQRCHADPDVRGGPEAQGRRRFRARGSRREETAGGRSRARAQTLRAPDARGGREGLPVSSGEPPAPALLSRDRGAREDHVPHAQARASGWSPTNSRTCTRSRAPTKAHFRAAQHLPVDEELGQGRAAADELHPACGTATCRR